MLIHNNAPGEVSARSIVSPVRIYRLLAWAVLAVVCVGLTACGSVGAGTSTSTAGGAPSTSVSAPGPTIGPPMPTSLAPATTTPQPIDVQISNGEVIGPEVFQVDRDDTVDLWMLGDVDDEVHVHGYDIAFHLEAGVPLNISFVAGIAGVFELELESAHTHLFDIEVSG